MSSFNKLFNNLTTEQLMCVGAFLGSDILIIESDSCANEVAYSIDKRCKSGLNARALFGVCFADFQSCGRCTGDSIDCFGEQMKP